MKNILLKLFSVLLFYSTVFSQSIPQRMNYQGVLKDGSGIILPDGSYSLTFKLYNNSTGGAALWSETQSVNLQSGIFSTQLGSITPITLPFTERYYLGVSVGAGSELAPRIPLSSVPYSFMSLNVPDSSLSAIKISNGQVVKSLNGLKDNINLVAGSNVTITPNGNNLNISSTGGGSGGISGSGSVNYVPMFSGSTAIGNSVIYQLNGNIGIGTTNPDKKFVVAGDAQINEITVGLGGGLVPNNSAFGWKSLNFNTSGFNNSAFGYNALYSNTLGYANTSLGEGTLYSNTTASRNIAIGNGALYTQSFNNGGAVWNSDNVAVGVGALVLNQPIGIENGNQNVALGNFTLHTNTTGSKNIAVGHTALYSNTNGFFNVAVGTSALYSNIEGYSNTATGIRALEANTTGSANTANGSHSLLYNSTGNFNSAFGYYALWNNTTGDWNTAIGSNCLENNTYGYSNVSVGHSSSINVTFGKQNTAVGTNSLPITTTGSYNTAVGYNAGPNGLGLFNSTCLGMDATASGSNMVRIGNASVTSIGGSVGWSTLSDARFKENIKEDVPGLNFIKQLRPVTYQLNRDRFNKFTKVHERIAGKDGEENSDELRMQGNQLSERQTGFIAQEVEQIITGLGYQFSGVEKPQNENDYYSLRYGEFVVPMVKAIQEQQKIIEELQKRIEILESSR